MHDGAGSPIVLFPKQVVTSVFLCFLPVDNGTKGEYVASSWSDRSPVTPCWVFAVRPLAATAILPWRNRFGYILVR